MASDNGRTPYERQWHLHGRSAGRTALVDPASSIRCEEAWNLTGLGSSNVVIALADDGCQVEHGSFGGSDKFAGALWCEADKWQFETRFTEFSRKIYAPGRTHGTSMAALIAATGGGHGTFGAAPGCRLLPIRMKMREAEVIASDEDVMAILDVIDEHADIAVISWSRVPLLIPSRNILERWADVATRGGRRGRGVLFVLPVGNSNCPLNHKAKQPIPYCAVESAASQLGERNLLSSRTFRNLLTDLPNLLHIAAITSLARRAPYSCYGPGVDLCAPSSAWVRSGQVAGDVHGLGLTTSYGPIGEITDAFKGTSGAAAVAAGAAALALSAAGGLSATELATILCETASKVGGGDTLTDSALPQPFESGEYNADGWSPWFGHGRIDALRAVKRASIS